MKKIFTIIFILSVFMSCSNLKQVKKPCINNILYFEGYPKSPVPPTIGIEVIDFKKIISGKIKTKILKSIIFSSNENESKIVIPFKQEIGFTVQFLKKDKIRLTAITYEFWDTINSTKKVEIEEKISNSNIDFVFGNETLRIRKCN